MGSDLQRILEEIKSSDVVESRIQLLIQLGDLDLPEKSDVYSLVECLTTLWEDFTCLDVSQCMLNKSVLHVASKYLVLNLPEHSLQFLDLGTKACQWCAKHLKMSLMSTEESQEEEHCGILFQLLLDYFRFSTSIFSALTKYSVMSNEASAIAVHKFVLEQFNITKEVISNAKKVDLFSSEIIKAAQAAIDSIVQLCKEYSQTMNWETSYTEIQGNKENIRCEGANTKSHFLTITADTVETLSELGVLAAKNGGSLVSILNTTWKGLITLLQSGKQALASKVKISDIVLKLVSLINESLRCTAEAWSCLTNEIISATEARRAFLPVKFYLINAVKVVSLFQSEVYVVHKEIALCVLMISTFKFSLSQEKNYKFASEVLTDLLDKLSVDLFSSLLNSNEMKCELKQSLLDWAFMDDKGFSNLTCRDLSSSSRTSLADVFSVSVGAVTETRTLLLGRVVLFQSIMKHSLNLEDDIKLSITTRLRWFLDILIEEEVYSSVLASQVVSIDGSGKTITWEPMFSDLVLALKTFMITVSSSPAWAELEHFLLENFFHPHFLCWEIVMELWCFLIRYAETNLVNDIIDKLCVVLKSLASSESVLIPNSALRKMARCVCIILKHGTNSSADRVYNFVVGDSSSDVYLALLLEGFPLNLLSDSLRNKAKQKLIADYFDFIVSFDGKLSSASRCGVFGAPVFALSACVHILQVSISDIDRKTLKFLASVICNFRNPVDRTKKEHCLNLMTETLAIISSIDDLYASNEMDCIILELQKLFISDQTASETDQLYKSKPDLALFMKGLGNMEMSENETCPRSSAVWELYHMILKERHWALVHLAVTAFGYFCARTTCNQLWRFVPQDAALAYDLVSGKEANTERFMSALRTFLEKEQAVLDMTPCSEHIQFLVKEGKVLKESVKLIKNVCTQGCEKMEIDYENRCSKRRKVPEGICKGVELLQNGLKIINDGLSQWQSDQMECDELHEKLLNHFSCLEDMVSRLIGLARTG